MYRNNNQTKLGWQIIYRHSIFSRKSYMLFFFIESALEFEVALDEYKLVKASLGGAFLQLFGFGQFQIVLSAFLTIRAGKHIALLEAAF